MPKELIADLLHELLGATVSVCLDQSICVSGLAFTSQHQLQPTTVSRIDKHNRRTTSHLEALTTLSAVPKHV